MPRRTRTTLAAVALAAACACTTATSATPASAATITTSGTGWKAFTAQHVTSISPSRQYTVTFSSTTTKNYVAKYLTRAIPQMTALGIHIKVGGVEAGPTSGCPAEGHIWVSRVYRPRGTAGVSQGLPCYDTRNGSAWSGVVKMDSEYYDGRYPLTTSNMWNTTVHETLGHAMGLAHPNTDLDHDGKVENWECPATSYGNKPVLCSPNGGYRTSTNMGKFVGFDVNSFKALVNNARLQGIS